MEYKIIIKDKLDENNNPIEVLKSFNKEFEQGDQIEFDDVKYKIKEISTTESRTILYVKKINKGVYDIR